MFGILRFDFLLKLLFTVLGAAMAIQVAASEIVRPADGEGSPKDDVSITWFMDSANSTSGVCLTNTCDLTINRTFNLTTLPHAACQCFMPDTDSNLKSVDIHLADLAVGNNFPRAVAWTVVQIGRVCPTCTDRIVSHVGHGTSYPLDTPSNLRLTEYGERIGLAWNANVRNADSYLVEVCCSADGSRATELVNGGSFSMTLPETLRAGCASPARGVKATVRACRNGGCGAAATLDVCSPKEFKVRRAEAGAPGQFILTWTPVASADSYMLEICCDASQQTEKHLISTRARSNEAQNSLIGYGMPYIMNVPNRFQTSCTPRFNPNPPASAVSLPNDSSGRGIIQHTGFKATLRPCTNGVCGESQSSTLCESIPIRVTIP